MLVDPLAVFFKPALAGRPALELSATDVVVTLLAPLARVSVTRTFANTTDELVEAVLTLPPVVPGEVVYGLTVRFGGEAYAAQAQTRPAAAKVYDAAVASGRRAILHERMTGDVQLISIAGIPPGDTVSVQVESIRPLYRYPGGAASLEVALTPGPGAARRGFADVDAPITTPAHHPASLRVLGDGVDIVVTGHDTRLGAGMVTPIDCEQPVSLHLTPHPEVSLDRSDDPVGGWSAAWTPGPAPANGPRLPGTITGFRAMADGVVRVIAPEPDTGAAPAIRAMTAFAAANLQETGKAAAAMRRAANVLERDASLVFVEAEGELPDVMPTLRKVALPGPASTPYTPPMPVLEPMDLPPVPETVDQLPEPPYPVMPRPPGAPNPQVGWLKLGRALLAATPLVAGVVWVASVPTYPPLPLGPVIAIIVLASLANAVLHWPPGDAPAARRRLPWLLALLLPPAVSLAGGPFGLMPDDLTDAQTWMAIHLQAGCMIASGVVPLGLLYTMRGARRLTLDLAGLAFVATFLTVSVAVITWSPGA